MSFSLTNFIIGSVISVFAYAAVKQKNYLVATLLFAAYVLISYLL